MRSKIITLVLSLSLVLSFHAKAESSSDPTQEQTSCDVIKDAFVWSLFKPIGNVLSQYNDNRQFTVDKIVSVKRLEQGQYYWEATLKVTTFEGAHNPPYLYYTMTFNNLSSDGPKAVKIEINDNN